MQLSQVRLLVDNFSACYRFYRDVIGLTPQFGNENDVYADFKITDDISFALFSRQEMAEAIGTTALPATSDSQDRTLVSFAVEDLEATLADLQQRNVELVAEPTDRPQWGMRTAHLRDPDGNLVEIYVPIPMEG